MEKKLLLLLLFLSFCGIAQATDWTQDANCQGAWLFDEGSGTALNDASTNNVDGTFASSGNPAWASMSGTNAPTYATYMVDFSSDNISFGNVLNITGTGFSYVGWINPDATVTDYFRIMERAGTYPDLQWSITLQDDTNKVVFDMYHIGGLKPSAVSTVAVGNTTWTHIAVLYDGANRTFYFNGTKDNDVGTDGNIVTRTAVVDMGWYRAGTGLYFDGKMSETAIFNIARSSSEISDIMDNGLAPAATGYGQVI